MIQRIQSVYLLIATIAITILLFIPIGTFYNDLGGYEFSAFAVRDITPDPSTQLFTPYLGLALIISAIFSVVAIFMYKNRNRQIRVVYVSMLVFLLAIMLMLYVYPDVIFVKKGFIASSEEFVYNFWIMACMLPAAFCLFFANKAIKNDEKKVRAADRLR